MPCMDFSGKAPSPAWGSRISAYQISPGTQASISSNQETMVLPRLGYMIKVPQRFADFTYYGRGPIDNYNDRKSSQFVEPA